MHDRILHYFLDELEKLAEGRTPPSLLIRKAPKPESDLSRGYNKTKKVLSRVTPVAKSGKSGGVLSEGHKVGADIKVSKSSSLRLMGGKKAGYVRYTQRF